MNRNGLKILLVDNDWRIRELMKFKFERFGYEVITAKNEQEFLKRALAIQPDLIILDIFLGNRLGTRLYDTLLALGFDPEIPVIFITGLKAENEPMRSDNYALHIKPFNFDELAEDAERLISQRCVPVLVR